MPSPVRARPRPETPAGDLTGRRQRLRDLALLSLLLGAFLLASPLLNAFAGGGNLGGVPLILLYIFSVWIGLIAVAGLLAGRLTRNRDDG